MGRAQRHGHARRRFCHRRHGHPGQAWWGWKRDHGRKRDVIHDQRVITVVKRTEIASYAKSFLVVVSAAMFKRAALVERLAVCVVGEVCGPALCSAVGQVSRCYHGYGVGDGGAP